MYNPRSHFWSPRSRSGCPKAWGPFWGSKRGPEKYNFVEGSVPHEVSQDFSSGAWISCYPGTLWVYQFIPRPSQGKVLQGFPPNPIIPWAPLGLWVVCLLSLCGPWAIDLYHLRATHPGGPTSRKKRWTARGTYTTMDSMDRCSLVRQASEA